MVRRISAVMVAVLMMSLVAAVVDVAGSTPNDSSGQSVTTFLLDPRAGYRNSPSLPPVVIDLAGAGLSPGSMLEARYNVPLPGWSFFGCSGPFIALDPFDIFAVEGRGASLIITFSSSNTLLPYPSFPTRIPDTIGVPSIGTEVFLTCCPDGFVIRVPPGATHLFLGNADSNYLDNCVPGNIGITPSHPRGASLVTVALFGAIQIHDLKDGVEILVAAGILNSGNGNSLTSKLDNALASLAKGNDVAAMNGLLAFINEVQGMMNGDNPRLTAAEGEPLIDGATAVVDQILGTG